MGEPRSMIPEKAAIDPGPAFSGRVAHAVGKEHSFFDHHWAPFVDAAKLAWAPRCGHRRRPYASRPVTGLDTCRRGRLFGCHHVGAVSPGPPRIPSDASDAPLSSCELATYVRDLAHDACPGGTAGCSRRRGCEEKVEGAQNSQADRRSAPKKIFYCVTTRAVLRAGGSFTRRRCQALLSPTPLLLGLGMLLPTLGCGSSFTLPLSRLPSPQFTQTVRLPAVPLPPMPCPVSTSTAFAEAAAPPQPSAPSRDIPFGCMLDTSHGRLRLPWVSPGRIFRILLGHLPIRDLILRKSSQRNPSPSDSLLTHGFTHSANAADGPRKETKEGAYKKLPAMQQGIKRQRRRQGRRRSRYDLASKETTKETIALTHPVEQTGKNT